MPDLVKKWREQHPYLSALEDEINADYNSQKYQYEKQNEQYEQQRKEYEQWVEANQYGPYGDERDQAGAGPYTLTPDMEYRRQAAAGAPNKLTPYQVAMQAEMAALPSAPETRSNAQLRNEARSLDAASRVARMESNRQGLTLAQNPSQMYNQQFTMGLRDLGNTANKLSSQAATAKEYASTIEAQRAATEAWQNYAHFRDNPDFVANSKPDPKVENRVYYSMAHPEEAIEENGAAVNAAAYADEDDKAMYFYLWNTYGHQAADKFYDDYVLNKASAAKAADVQRKAMIEGYDKPFASSVKSIGTNVISGVGLVDMFFQNIARDFGITNPNRALNYNSLAQMPSLVTDSIREGVMKNLNGQKVDDETVDAAAWTAAWLYQNFMSAADSGVGVVLTALGVPSAATLAIMAGAAGTRAIQDARKRGATDSEALRFGMLSAAAEAAFEKISLDVAVDSLLGSMGKDGVYSIGQAILKALGKDSSRNAGAILAQWALNSLTNSFVEGSEELLTTIANDFSDRLIMGDRSEFEQKRQELLAMGVSDKEAARAALKSTINEALQDAAAGAFSGFLMGGGTTFAGQALRPIASTISDRMQLARNLTDYQRGAQQLRQMESELRQMTRDQSPPAAPAVQQRQLTAREQNPLQFAMNKAQNGETVTGNDAKAILNDPQAMQTLRDAGVLAETIRPGAEGRTQIQQAVMDLAEQSRAEMPESQQTTERTSQLPVQNQQETAQERTTPPLPRQMAQEQQERVTTPPVPQNTQEAAQEPTLRLRAQEEQAPRQETLRIRDSEVAEPTQQAPLTIRGANATVEENRQEENYGQGQQTETAAAAGEDDFRARAETAAEGARRSYLDRIERSSGLGRVLQDLRNYRIVRGAESRASEVSRIRNQAEAGNQRDISAQDYGIANGSAEQSAKELDSATASKVLGRNWDRAVAELAREGVTLKAMTGQLKKEDGSQVRAFFSGDGKTIVVQIDHPKLSWNQLLDHEDLHRRIKANKNYRKAVEDALLADKNLRAYLPEIIDRYSRAYAEHAPDLTSDDVIEELLADYRAGFDMLDPLGMNPTTARAAKWAAKDIKSAEKTLRKQVDEQRPVSVDDEARASREFDSDYMQAAVTYNQTSKHVPDSLMNDVAKVRETIKAKLEKIQDEARLPADVTGNTYFGNGSYNGSEENTTVCPRSLSVDALADAVGDALGRPLTIEETVYVAQQAFHFTDVPQCLYCYVAMDRMAKRQLLGEYVNKRTQVLTDIQNGMNREEALAAYKNRETSGGKKWSKNKQARFERWVNDYESGKPTLKMSDLSSEAQVEKTLANPDLRAEAQDALQYAQNASWAKKRVSFTAYNNHILKWDQKRINALNSMFGLRMYSFSDFSPAFILENMQMVTDAAVRGLKMLAYTKELDFVRIFAGTGMNINISTFGMDGGDGKVHMDAMQGADWKEAQELRKKYPNVGVTFVATNDNQVNWALDQDWIDVVIPFHMVKTGATVADILGYQNYTGESSDKKIAGEKAKQKEIFPSQHQNNKEKYLAALEKAHLTPRFERWLDNPNYMKLVNETRRSAGDTPAVQPKFDQDAVNAALKSLDDMVKRGGYGVPIGGSLENLADIAEEMSDDIRKGIAQDLREHNRQKGKAESQQEGKASTEIDADYLAAVESGDMETAQRMVDEAAKKAGYTIRAYHGTRSFGFTEFDPTRSDDGISLFATSDPQTAESYSGRTKRTRITDRTTKKAEDLSGKELLAEAQKINRLYDRYKLMNNSDRERLRTETESAISWSIKRAQEYVRDHRDALDADKSAIMDRLISALYHLRDSETENEVDDAWTEWEDAIWDLKGIDDDIAMEFLDDVDSRGLFINKNDLQDLTYQGDMYIDWALGEHVFDQQLQIEVNADYHKGIYELYGKPGKQLAVYANGENWNAITPPKVLTDYGLDGPQRTRDIASAAKALGYDSVVFFGLRDNGGETAYNGKSNVYIFFDANQLKSADPVTYDDKGKPISLSERFNPKNDDIRFSREVTDEDMLRRLNKAEQEGIRNFSEITEGDKKGVVKVYRAMQAQPVDESGNVIPNASVRRIVSYDPLIVEAKVFTKNGRKKTSEIITAPAKLFSPMAGQNNGVWRNPIELNKWEMSEGHPERATTQIDEKTGKPKIDNDKKNASYGEVAYWYGLDKGGVDDNGNPLTPVPARYNPYSHTSLSALNDQFSSAEKRPELVTVESLVPVWHINNGAENERLPLAKDRVGAMSWHSGPTSSRLAKIGKPRTVILTRYDKPIRVVPDTEVAKSIADTIGDSKNVAIPASTVTPSLAKELKALGVNVLNAEEWKQYNQQFPTKTFGRTSIEIDPEVAAQFSPEAIARRQANRTKGVKGERKVSRVRSNTYEYSGLYNEVEAQMDEADEENYTYDSVSEKKSMNEALGRLKADFDGEVSRLSEADRQWGGSDLDTAMGILHRYRTEGRATGDYGDFWRWSKVIQEKGTKGGQFIQAFAKYTRTGTGAAMKGAKDIHDRFKLNPAQQKQVDAAKKKLMDGIDGDMNSAAQDAMKQAKGQKEPGKKQDGKVDKKKLDAEVQRRKDAERLVREISKLFEKQQDHGEPVENWLNLTGEELARKIAGRFSEPKQRAKTTMQTILSDLVGFAEEHALPDRKKAEGTKRTAIDIITDYLNNRDAYGTAWAAAQSYLRAAYTDDQEKLDALNSFLTATIAYNAEGTDRTMLDAILQSADVLGISEKRILELTSAGATASTIDRIGDELVNQVKEHMGADYDESFTQQLKDAVRRHITGIALQESAEEQRLRLGGMTTDAARQLEINLQKLLTQSRGDKNRAAQSVADYLIRELGIPSSDAAIAAERITGAFMDELASRADRKLQQMFAEKKPKTQEQRDKLLDLIRLGGLTNSNVEDAVVDALGIGGMSRERQRELVGAMAQFGETLDAMEADDAEGLRQLIREQAAVRGTKLSRLSEKTLSGETDIEYLRDFALAQLASIAGDFENRSAGEMISTYQTISHLLNMRTALRNVTSNQVFDLIDSAANNVSLLPDIALSLMTGKRTVGLNKSWASQQKRQGAVQGARRNALEVNLDVGVDDRQKSKYGTAGRRTWAMASSRTAGKILSHLEEVMGYELNTTDEFHKGSVMGETLDSLSRFVDRGDMTLEEAQEFATEMALYRSFQDDSLIGTMLSSIKDALNLAGIGEQNGKQLKSKKVHDFGLGDFVTKYTQVPGALVHRAIEFSPLGYAKALFNLGQLAYARRQGYETNAAQRKAALAIGRATTGTGLITLFAALAKAGLLRRDEDEDKNAKAAHQAQGLNGTQLNLTALGRKIEGGSAEPEDGDILIDINFLEPLDALMGLATLVANEDERNLESIWNDSITAVWDSISSLSMMQTLRDAYNVYQYYDDKAEDKMPLMNQMLLEIASSSLSGFIPSPVRQLAQATDTTYRDQYRSKKISDQMRDKAKNSIPGLRQTLAPKITPLGEDKKYEKPLLNYLNATLNPGNISVYKSNKIVSELNRVYDETENANIWPERNAPYSFTVGKEKYTLTPDERTQYQRTRGQETAKMMEEVIGTSWYKTLDPAVQADVLNWIGLLANDLAKAEMLRSRDVKYTSSTYGKYEEQLANGESISDVVRSANRKMVDYMEAGLTMDEIDELKGLKGKEQRDRLKGMDLTDSQKLTVYKNLTDADSRAEKFQELLNAGLSFNEVMNIYDKYESLDKNEDLKASDQSKDFALWVDKQSYTANQKAAIKEQMKYWQIIPAEAERYEKFTNAGFSPDVASAIDKAISDLTPLPGHDGVTNAQKWNAALGALGKNASQKDKLKAVGMITGTEMKTESGKPTQWANINRVVDSGKSVEDTMKLVEDEKLDVYVRWMDSDAKAAGVKSDTYISFREKYNNTKSVKDANGKDVKGQTKKDQMMAYINGLNLTADQKDKLFLEEYAESGLKDTPWHKGGGKGSGSYAMARTPALRLPDAPRAEKPSSGLRIRDTQSSEARQSSGLRLPATNAAPRQSSGLRIK